MKMLESLLILLIGITIILITITLVTPASDKTETEQLECPVCQDCKEVNELYQEELDTNKALIEAYQRCDRDRYLMKTYIENIAE